MFSRRSVNRYRVEPLERRCLLASISGTLLADLNNNGAPDAGETPLSGWTVFLDQNKNRKLDAGEATRTTNGAGQYSFTGLANGTYYVAQDTPVGWQQTYPTLLNKGISESSSGSGLVAQPVLTTTGSGAAAHVSGEVNPTGDPTPNDAESNSLIRLTNFRADGRFAGVDGSGFSVAILDTGIDLNHPMFGPDADANGVADRIRYQWDFADNDADASDVNGHGSNVTSIAAGSDTTNSGMAPGAGIVALKVFSNNGSGLFSYIENALKWLVTNAATYNIAAVNMSLGDSANWATPQQLYGINDELAALAAQNVIVVSASGNDYFKFQAQGVAYPAADPNSLAIGATYDANLGRYSYSSGAVDNTTAADRVTSFSQRSTTLVDAFAPGALITGAGATGGTTSYTGTSQASPHIAGIATLAQQLAQQRIGRRLTPAEFTQILKDTTTTIYDGDDENDNVTNANADFGRVDVLKLGDAIYNTAAGEYYPLGHKIVLTGGAPDRTNANFGARTIGDTAPGRPEIRAVSDTGRLSADYVTKLDNGSAANRLEFVVPGVIPGATVTLYADGVAIGSTVATAATALITTNGAVDIADGARLITARQQAPSQALSAASVSRTLTVDTIAPAIPAAPDLAAASDTGVSSTDNITNDTTPTFTFSVGTGNYYQLYRGNVLLSSTYASGTTYTPSGIILPDGTNNYTVLALDAAGNEAASPGLPVTIDTNAFPIAGVVPGTLDAAFGTGGASVSTGLDDDAFAMARQPDGKIVVVGAGVNPATGQQDFLVLRYLANGQPDTAFGVNGRATTKVQDLSEATAVAIQSDGKIVVGGWAGTGSRPGTYYPRLAILRFNANGTLDTTFAAAGVFRATTSPMTNNGQVEKLAILPNGRILATFGAGSNGNWADFGMCRLTTTGALDTTFDGDGWAAYDFSVSVDDPTSFEVLNDGKLLVIGRSYSPTVGSSSGRLAYMRLTANGALDTTFDGDGRLVSTTPFFTGNLTTALQPDGKLLVGVSVSGSIKSSVSRIDPATGALDATFGVGGVATFSQFEDWSVGQIVVQPDGRIAIGGSVSAVHRTSYTAAVFRLEANGTPDPTFGTNGVATAYAYPVVAGVYEHVRGMVQLSDGSYITAITAGLPYDGTFPARIAVARFLGGDAPVAAGPVDLQAASDLGTSGTDNLTADNTPTFDLPNLAGGYARVYRNGTLASASYVTGPWTSPTVADGTAAYTVRYVDAAGNESAPAYSAPALTVTVDTIAPVADVVDVSPDPRTTAVPSMTVTFTTPVTGFDVTDLSLTRDGTPLTLTASQAPTTTDNLTFTIPNLASLTGSAGAYVLSVNPNGSIRDAAGNATAAPASDAWTFSAPADATPPTVTGVFVGSTAWASNFRTFLTTSGLGDATFGYGILASEQTDELPWTNLNQVSVRFSENVVVAADDLIVRGVNSATYPLADTNNFAYDPATFTATWTLATAGIVNDKLLLDLDADAGTGVADATGNRLDGEWTNPVAPAVAGDAFPSGNAAAGGDFLFRLNVLPGDVNRSGGSVIGSDVTSVRNAQNSPPGGAGSLYTIFKDVNGSGTIVGSDVTNVRNRQGLSLPAGEPGVPSLRQITTTAMPKTSASASAPSAAPPVTGTTLDALKAERLTDGLV